MTQSATTLFMGPKWRFVVLTMFLSLFPAQEFRFGAFVTNASEALIGIQINQQALANAEEERYGIGGSCESRNRRTAYPGIDGVDSRHEAEFLSSS
jgi:hypothetical protein